MPIKIAINGFGRIGRAAFKIAQNYPQAEIVAINDLTDPKILAHLLRFDTNYGIFGKSISVEEEGQVVHSEDNYSKKSYKPSTFTGDKYLVVDGKKILVLSQKDATQLPWGKLGVDVVLECTGRFTDEGAAQVHVTAGAKKVVVSAPTKGGGVNTYLFGVNSTKYAGEQVISNASCTTNCISPVASIVHAKFGISKASMTTIHAITAEQSLVDGPPPPLHPDMRRARAAGYNLVPTTTGAAISTTEVIPELKGLFDGLSVRAPISVGSLSDFTIITKRAVTVDEVNQAFIDAKDQPLYRGVLDVSYQPLVSSDIVGSSFSSIVDLSMTKVIGGDMLKLVAWYDNEWGYSNRLVEMALRVATA